MDQFFVPFFTIAAAELFDKSQLAILLLATRNHKHLVLFTSVALAFGILSLIAVLVGGTVAEFIPPSIVKIGAGILFLFFGIQTLLQKSADHINTKKKSLTFWGGFLLIFLSELGDKTQLATITFATQFPPFIVFLASFAALLLLAILAIWLGKMISRFENKAIISKIAGIIFIILGFTFLFNLT